MQSNLFSFAFVDPTMLLSTMTLKYGRHFEDNPTFTDCRTISLRGPRGDAVWTDGVEIVDQPLMQEWPTARQLIDNVTARITELLAAPNLQIGSAYIESIKPGGLIPWHADSSDYAKAHQRFKMIVSPCFGGTWYSGGEAIAPGIGNLTHVNNRVLNSAINLGSVPQISLVIDFRKPPLQ